MGITDVRIPVVMGCQVSIDWDSGSSELGVLHTFRVVLLSLSRS